MHVVGHVVALAPRDEVAPIRDHLARLGFVAQTRQPEPGTYEVEDTSFREHLHRLRNGLVIGAVVGASLGVLMISVWPTLRDAPAIVRLLAVAGVALQGTMPTMMWRMSRVEHFDDDARRLQQVNPGDTMIVVDAEHSEGRVRHVLERHHVTFLADDHPMAGAA